MKRLLLSMLTTASLATASPVAAADNGASADLQKLFNEDWELFLEQHPLSATFYGDHRYNDKLPHVSEEANRNRKDITEASIRRLDAIDREALSAVEQVNYDIFRRLKENQIKEFEFRVYLMPITNRSGFHVAFPQLPDRVPLNTVTDYENYVARLNGFKSYAREHIEVMTTGIAEGYVLPRIVLKGFESTIEPHIVEDPTHSLLYKPFKNFPDRVTVPDRQRLSEAGAMAIKNSVVPGYRLFLKFMRSEYLPAARLEIGASYLPAGREFYEHRVHRYTTLPLAAEEIHDIGRAEVDRIRGEMEEIIAEVGFEGSFSGFVEFLRTDDRFYVDTPEDLMRRVAYVLKKMDGELPGLFKTLPRMPYGIKPVPEYIAPKTTTAYYNRPAGDGTKAGLYYVNTYDLQSRPTYEIEALSLHEAVPGHHLQIAIQQELDGIPEFRRFTGFTVFVEGWALYSERLGLEAGFYEDPYSNFGRLTYEMWRACRLVVDTGMHYLGWSRQQAIDFMVDNTALTKHNITTEVDRYISWPGQALAYKMGELKIRELRSMAQEQLGARFDVREFHDVVLGSGAVPLDILEANVNRWVSNSD
ncbi:MAG: DUF885 domain-containing protein [Candidatus Krumholzibacteria bacterium]|nr:DUF885 domain-containing protein [Candidatus Krumholzibacteria bacterium]